MTMDMNKDKETLLEDYSDEIARVIVKMYEEIQNKQAKAFKNLSIVDEKLYRTTQAQLDILLELALRLDDTFPQYMATSCIFTEEEVEP